MMKAGPVSMGVGVSKVWSRVDRRGRRRGQWCRYSFSFEGEMKDEMR